MIFDDLCFSKKTYSQKLNLFDAMQETTIRVLFGVVHIPVGTLKVFTSNVPFIDNLQDQPIGEAAFNKYQIQALLRRVCVVHIERSLFTKPESQKVPPKPCKVVGNSVEVDSEYDLWWETPKEVSEVRRERTNVVEVETEVAKRPRGRPRLKKEVEVEVEVQTKREKRVRGRPKKAFKVETPVEKRPRGRPRKDS